MTAANAAHHPEKVTAYSPNDRLSPLEVCVSFA